MHTYDIPPADLLDWCRWALHMPSDRALAALLGVTPPTLSKVRHGVLPIGPTLMVKLLELTNVRLRELPELLDQTAIFWRRRCQR
jgi:DNA-binding transcriptional regulator YdaS (Cro superfamily)